MLPKILAKNGNFIQILILSFSFMLIFTAFQTTCIIEQTVLTSVKIQDPSFNGNGYISLCIIYGVFAFCSWIAPSIVAVVNSKWSMICSAFVYVFFIASFIIPRTWLLYLTSVLIGGAAAILWTAQGNFLTLASTPKTISRNSGVFWAINQCSLFFGNLFVFYQFYGKTEIDADTRVFVFIVLSCVSSAGVGCMLLLKNLKKKPESLETADSTIDSSSQPSEVALSSSPNGASCEKQIDAKTETEAIPLPLPEVEKMEIKVRISIMTTAMSALKEALRLFVTPYMLLLSITSIYTGLEQSYWSGVFHTSIGFTAAFGDSAKRLVGLVGILTGVGEVLGGTVFGLLGSKTTKRGRSPIVLLGMLTHAVCYVLVYLNLPDESTYKHSEGKAYFDPPVAWIGILCALLLGFGDACYQTQLFAVFGSVYADKSASAFAIFKFTQSAASAAAFFYSSYAGMFAQTVTLFSFAIFGFLAFFIVELGTKKANKNNSESSACTT